MKTLEINQMESLEGGSGKCSAMAVLAVVTGVAIGIGPGIIAAISLAIHCGGTLD